MDQTVFLVSNSDDGRHINLVSKTEHDFTDNCNISSIKYIIYDEEEQLYCILANKFQEKLGFFIIKMKELNPNAFKFLIRWKNKLDIGDTYGTVCRNHKKGFKELIISYKTIYINTFNVIVMDITTDDESTLIFRHESFQLWESEC
jgi:hypothetical protein